jgi:hypothetical protein
VSSHLSQVQEWRARRDHQKSRGPRPLIERESSAWPWVTTVYLGVFIVAALIVSVPEHCAGDWPFARAAQAGAVLAPALDAVLISRRRGSWSLAIAVGTAAIVACMAVLWLVILLRGGAANCFG